ncbi:ABC transporter ATP-binding protein [Pyrococcus horikoshii]|uniref:ABC transporter ATP-binding protein n=2 Tax=Pyrococcus horikoshii TaxID=53953 RepID=A0A832W789_PYRHR|nr:ABC transporter ATP-binding protein [Pyrococcus horikoshii]BAA30827.1 498aa long hypothetical sugar transport ATP-binding protein [Pyrococcus horikoshii OT3]HII60678.1 ABC transporter ATP-binding protein [Pyrococcus horikoshii]
MLAVEMRRIYKVYPDGVVALKGVDFTVEEGEIHGLLGENGAGKSTLMRILYGEIKPTKGEVKVFGDKVEFNGPWDAIRKGIAMVYQHFTLIPTFTVLENLYLSMLTINPNITINEVRKLAKEKMKDIGFSVPLDDVVEDLPIGIQQRVEIIKALMANAKILILDEPTSVLTPLEVEELFKTLRKLKENGITVIFITHKLKEVKEITDRVTVLRRGEVVGVAKTKEVSERDLAKMMVQREIVMEIKKSPASPGNTVLRVEDLWVKDDRGLDAVKGVSFELKEGEILGIAGVQGNGQKELAEALAGIRRIEKGRIELLGRDVTELSADKRYKAGLAYVPDSRKVGLVLDMSVVENVILTNLPSVMRGRRISWEKANKIGKEIVERFDVLVSSLSTPIKHLSGGNQQKVMVGREIIREPKVVIVSEPTQGLDIGATEFIRKTLVSLRDQGKGILLISTDLDEILQLSDRIAVMYEGKIMAIGKVEEFTLEKLGLLMGGVNA